MNAVIQILKKYGSFVTAGWFTAEILASGSIILKYYYPLEAKKTVYVFDDETEFYTRDCLEILKLADFIQVKDK
jgi:hypothetical protein